MNFFIQLALMVVSYVIQNALAPKPKAPQAATLDSVDAPLAEEGVEVPVIFGDVWLRSPNVLWYGDMGTTPIQTKSSKK